MIIAVSVAAMVFAYLYSKKKKERINKLSDINCIILGSYFIVRGCEFLMNNKYVYQVELIYLGSTIYLVLTLFIAAIAFAYKLYCKRKDLEKDMSASACASYITVDQEMNDQEDMLDMHHGDFEYKGSIEVHAYTDHLNPPPQRNIDLG